MRQHPPIQPFEKKTGAVGYIRVSTKAQAGDGKYGIEAQKADIINYAKENGYDIKKWYIDRGESGAKVHRTEFDRIIYENEVYAPLAYAVIVSKADRVARDIYIYYAFKQKLQARGIKLISVHEDFGEMGAFSVVLESFIVAMAQVERETIRTRTMRGRQLKAAHGCYSGGRAPYGYDIKDKKLLVNEKEAKMIRKIFEMIDAGLNYQLIANWLSANGYRARSGKDLVRNNIQRIADNRKLYEGYYKYGEMGWVKGQQEAILKPNEPA